MTQAESAGDAESAATDRELRDVLTVALAVLIALFVGYEFGSYVAGDSLDLLPMVPVVLGCLAVLLALHADDEE